MLHINSNKNSMMFNRRHRGWIQTTIILILIVALGYGVYLYNVLQGKMQLMDIKSQRFKSQQQSLSAQLQVVYEDRSKLEGSLQQEKLDHQNTKDELEQNMHSHQTDLEKMDKEHQIKYEELHEKHLLTQEQLEEANKKVSEHQARYKDTDQQYQDKIEELKRQIASKSGIEENNNILQGKLDELQRAHRQLQQMHDKLQGNNEINEKEVMKYIKLQSLLNGLGADALKLDHPNVGKLHPNDRALIFGHFGGDPNNVQAMEDSRARLLEDKRSRSEALEKQRLEKLRRDKEIAERNKKEPKPEAKKSINENCLLPKKVGDCENTIERFYYDPRVGSCLKFIFTGCGGNYNNFASVRECEEKCHIEVAHQRASNEALNAPGQDMAQGNDVNDDNNQEIMDNNPHLEDNNGNGNPLRAQQYSKDQHESDEQNDDQRIQGEADENEAQGIPQVHEDVDARNDADDSREDRFPAEGQIQDADADDDKNPNEPREETNYRDNPEERNSQLDQVQSQEDEARAAEKLAQLELDAHKSQNEGEDSETKNDDNPIEKLQELQKEQQKIIDVQSENIKELVEKNQEVQHKGQVHGEIFEEEAAKLGVDKNNANEGDEEVEETDEDEDQAQVDVPPAGRPFKQEPHFVGDAPLPADGQNHGEDDFNDDQNYNGENDNGDGEQYEDENDDNNEGANDGYADETQDRADGENDADSRHREALAQANKVDPRRREM